MDEQRVPDLEGMDERAAHKFLTELYSLPSAEAQDRIRHDEYTMEWARTPFQTVSRRSLRDTSGGNWWRSCRASHPYLREPPGEFPLTRSNAETYVPPSS